MLLTEYDYDTDIAVQRQEAYEDGMEQGISQGSQQAKIETAMNFISMGLTVEQVSKGTGLSMDFIKTLKDKS